MNKKKTTRNKKIRNKRIKNRTKKGGYNKEEESEKQNEINKSIRENILNSFKTDNIISKSFNDGVDKMKKIKDDYSYSNMKKRQNKWKNDLEKAVEEEEKKMKEEKNKIKEEMSQENLDQPKPDMKERLSKLKDNIKDKLSYFGNSIKKTASKLPSFGSKSNDDLSSKTILGISDEHKEIIIEELNKLKQNNKLTEEEYKYIIDKLSKKNVFSGLKESFFNILSPVQNMVKVVADFIFNSDDPDFPEKKTYVKILWVPKMYKNYVKNKIPDKNQKPELEIDDFIIIVKDVFASPMEKIYSDMNSVDNLLANILNGCIGARCKNGIVNPPILLEKSLEVTNNIRRKEVLEQRKKQKELDIELSSK
jgi:hypothetical protein